LFLYLNRERPEWIGEDTRGGYERMQGLITEEENAENGRETERYSDVLEAPVDVLNT
jgi:hypothetical protein